MSPSGLAEVIQCVDGMGALTGELHPWFIVRPLGSGAPVRSLPIPSQAAFPSLSTSGGNKGSRIPFLPPPLFCGTGVAPQAPGLPGGFQQNLGSEGGLG